eukprot:15331647-Ditylum_brightwellii.AAC.1
MELIHWQMVTRKEEEEKGNQISKVNSQNKKAAKKQTQMKVLKKTLEMKKRLMLTMMPSKELSKISYCTKK